MTPFRLSVAIPVYNEEAVLPELLRRTRDVLDRLPGGPHEIVFADDGSSDQTPMLLSQAAERDPRICVVTLSRNFGHQTALTAALDYVTGDATAVIDGDLQDPPEAIPQLVERFAEGYDVVYVQRVKRKESLWLRLCFWFFYRLVATLSDRQLPLDAGDFGLMSRRVVEQLRGMKEHHRYLRGLRSWVGFRQVGIPLERAERHAGESKYSAWRLIKLAADGIFAFSIVPLRAAALLGMTAIVLSVLFALYSVYAKFVLHQTVPGFTALIVSITFLSGINLFFLGVIGEYLGRIYEEMKSRPLYVVSHVAGGQAGTPGSWAEAAGHQGRRVSRSQELDAAR
ncbi:MAG TPA: glycosyltransferase family 2 protein [Terriglobales bacterium]|jgi:dolichol-phosphate mannosyltransferase